jgi:predicted metal-binding membrane protein
MVDVGTPVRNGRLATPDDDWPTQAADTIERVVGSVRDKTTGPALTVSRALVYGTFAVIVGLAAFVLAVIAAVRLLDSYLPDAVFGEDHTWAAHLITGLVFTIAGLFAWSKRTSRPEETGTG